MAELIVTLSKKLNKSIEKNAALQDLSVNAYISKILEREVIPSEYLPPDIIKRGLPDLVDFLNKIPGIQVISSDQTSTYLWWVKFDINIHHKYAWRVIQELGFVLNFISLTDQLPTVFKPVSPPPYLNGGPEGILSWVIESSIAYLDPGYIASILEDRLPRPVEDEKNWGYSDDESESKKNWFQRIYKWWTQK